MSTELPRGREYVVCLEEEIPPGEHRVFPIGRSVVADHVPGGASAVRSGEYLYCPWHQWGFELATGTTAVKPEWSIRTYPVKVLDHQVIVTG